MTGPLLIILVIAGFAFVFTQFGSSSSSSSALASTGAIGASGAGRVGPRRIPANGLSAGSVPQYETDRAQGSGLDVRFVVTESGTRYRGATLASQVREQLDALSPSPVTPAASPVPIGTSASAEASAASASSA